MQILITGVTSTEESNNKSVEDIFKEKCLNFLETLDQCDKAEFELYDAKRDVVMDFEKFDRTISHFLERVTSPFDLTIKTSCGNQYMLRVNSGDVKGWKYFKDGKTFNTSTSPFSSKADYEDFKAQILADLCVMVDKKQAVVDKRLKQIKQDLANWKKESK
jgi:hypothetical protein